MLSPCYTSIPPLATINALKTAYFALLLVKSYICLIFLYLIIF